MGLLTVLGFFFLFKHNPTIILIFFNKLLYCQIILNWIKSNRLKLCYWPALRHGYHIFTPSEAMKETIKSILSHPFISSKQTFIGEFHLSLSFPVHSKISPNFNFLIIFKDTYCSKRAARFLDDGPRYLNKSSSRLQISHLARRTTKTKLEVSHLVEIYKTLKERRLHTDTWNLEQMICV